MDKTNTQDMSSSMGAPPKKKALFLLVDALRFDVLEDPKSAEFLAPNMASIAKRGIVRKCITNAQSTQFVLPSLFTQSYPLDYGGYNNGIRDRPKSFVESLKDAGFETHLMSSSNQIGVTMGFDRGFDSIRTTTDYRTLLEQRISRALAYEIGLWREGKRTREEAVEIVQKELGLLLETLEEGISRHDKSLWPPVLHRINSAVARGCAAERTLLETEPMLVIEKLERVPAGVYWRFLGRRSVNPSTLFLARATASIATRIQRWAAYRWWFPIVFDSHYQVKCGEVMPGIVDFVLENKDRRWYVHMHAMDAHDCRCWNRPLHMLHRMTYLPRWWLARLTGLTKRRWTYDTAIMYVDSCLGKLFKALAQTGQLESTTIVITGDHGADYALSPRKKKYVGMRTYREDIEVPMVLVCDFGNLPSGKTDNGAGLIDSMGLCASFLEALEIPQHQSYKGVSVFRGGRDAVISENAGSGNADIERRDLYFTVTTDSHKLMTVLKGDELHLLKLYDLSRDPDELDDMLLQEGHAEVVRPLVEIFKRERREVLELRGAAAAIDREEWTVAT